MVCVCASRSLLSSCYHDVWCVYVGVFSYHEHSMVYVYQYVYIYVAFSFFVCKVTLYRIMRYYSRVIIVRL